ncbi:hypothetical protein SDC9_169204 [bioreactor metagenome]|uniref:Uncharacterized protein n=1 Tax=bioreactor metagenome TaxID=1076179 RepID=A0A645G780_9ZZZZ
MRQSNAVTNYQAKRCSGPEVSAIQENGRLFVVTVKLIQRLISCFITQYHECPFAGGDVCHGNKCFYLFGVDLALELIYGEVVRYLSK